MVNKKFLIRAFKFIYPRVSPTYYATRRLIKSTEFASEDKLLEMQFRQLRKALIHAYDNSPFYRETFTAAGVNPHAMTDIREIQSYPLLTKDQYRKNVDRIMSQGAIKPLLIRTHTGGTTGEPLTLFRKLKDSAREKAFLDHVYEMQEMDPSSKTVYMRGEVFDSKGIYHHIGNMGNVLYLSSNNMTDKNLSHYVELIREFKPRLFYTIPSVATTFVEYMKRNNIPHFEELKWIFCPSENLYAAQRNFIEDVLHCRIATFYGHAEHAAQASLCTKSTMYHVLPQYGYVELVDNEGKIVDEEGMIGEIVATSFTNNCSHFIRYRTGDYAVYTEKKCGCGHHYKMWERIQGREQAIAISKKMEKISIGPDLLCTIFDKSFANIKQFKIVQQNVGELIFLVTPHEGSNIEEVTKYFKGIFDDRYPGGFDIVVQQPDENVLKRGDKHLYFKQYLDVEELFKTN